MFSGKFVLQLDGYTGDVEIPDGLDVLELHFKDCPDGNLQPGGFITYVLTPLTGPEIKFELEVDEPPHFDNGWEILCVWSDPEELGAVLKYLLSDNAYASRRERRLVPDAGFVMKF